MPETTRFNPNTKMQFALIAGSTNTTLPHTPNSRSVQDRQKKLHNFVDTIVIKYHQDFFQKSSSFTDYQKLETLYLQFKTPLMRSFGIMLKGWCSVWQYQTLTALGTIGTRFPGSVSFLFFSCCFRQTFCQILCWRIPFGIRHCWMLDAPPIAFTTEAVEASLILCRRVNIFDDTIVCEISCNFKTSKMVLDTGLICDD